MPFQCQFIKPDGHRCKLHTLKGNFCWLHAKQQYHIHVKNSNVHGLGLFAEKSKKSEPNTVFKSGQTIVPYTGTILNISESELDKRIDNGLNDKYIVYAGKKHFIDGIDKNSSYARYANDSRRTKFKKNSKLSVNIQKHTVSLKATQAIKNGNEIFVAYGKKYWENR